MGSIFAFGCFVAVLLRPGLSDIYLHCPPGSNNRLNDANQDVNSNTRTRLFDSQVELHLYAVIYICVRPM